MKRPFIRFRFLLLSLLLAVTCLAGCRRDSPSSAGDPDSSQVKIEVSQDGVYRVTLAGLQEAGMAVEMLDAGNLVLKQESPLP